MQKLKILNQQEQAPARETVDKGFWDVIKEFQALPRKEQKKYRV